MTSYAKSNKGQDEHERHDPTPKVDKRSGLLLSERGQRLIPVCPTAIAMKNPKRNNMLKADLQRAYEQRVKEIEHLEAIQCGLIKSANKFNGSFKSVSYTHLTLPTIYSV